MSKGKQQYKKMNMSPQEYQSLAKTKEPKQNVLVNCIKSFLIGGAICCFGQLISDMYIKFFNFTKETAGDPTVATLIFISVVLTSLGVYSKFGQFAGAGSAVPVTGFANSMSSAAIEYRSEGLVLGVGANMFKLAGSVVVFGTVAAFIVGIAYMVLGIEGH